MTGYETPDPLDVRVQTHRRYTRPQLEFAPWALDHVAWTGEETVVDVGCGTGEYRAPVLARARRYVAGDFSRGMLVGQTGARVQLDAVALPLRGACTDVVLVNHMLYHVPHVDAALAEAARVLRPNGTLLATTNSVRTMSEFRDALVRTFARVGARYEPPPDPSACFALENAEPHLRKRFGDVRKHVVDSALVFPDAAPVVAYLDSCRDIYESALPEGALWIDLLEAFRCEAPLRVTKAAGVFVCTVPWYSARASL